MTGVTASQKQAVLQAMPAPPAWATAQQVYNRMELLSINTIKQCLLELSREGKVAKFGPLVQPAFRRIDLPDHPMDEYLQKLVDRYQIDLAEWKVQT